MGGLLSDDEMEALATAVAATCCDGDGDLAEGLANALLSAAETLGAHPKARELCEALAAGLFDVAPALVEDL